MAQSRTLNQQEYLDIIYYFLDGSEEEKKKFVDALNSHPIMGEYPATDKQLKRTASKYFFNFLFNNKTENSLSSSTTSIPHLTHLVNLPNANNKSPLMHAVETQNLHAVKFLLENGAERQLRIVIIALGQYLKKRDNNLYQITKSTIDTELNNKALSIFFYILDFMIQKNLPELQEKLPPLLLYYLKNTNPENFNERIFYEFSNRITDFSKVNYFHALVKFQNPSVLLFMMEKTPIIRFRRLNEEKDGETPLTLLCKQEPKAYWLNCIELLISQGSKVKSSALKEIEEILKRYEPKVIVDYGMMFLSENEKVNLLHQREAWFRLCLQKYNIAWVDRSRFENLKVKNLLPPNLIYFVKDQNDNDLVYTHQNQLFSLEKNINLNRIKEILNEQLSTPSYDVKQSPEKQTYLSFSERSASEVGAHILIAIKQDQQKRNIPINFNGVDIKQLIEITQTPNLDIDWTFANLNGATFESWWLYTVIPSLVGVKVDTVTLKKNGFQINLNEVDEDRFGEEVKKLKEKFVKDYQYYFNNQTNFELILNTLNLFIQDKKHITKLHCSKVENLFGETNSFKTIMRTGQARLHALSQETGFRWNSTNAIAQQQLNAIFKINYTDIKNPVNDIMQISVSEPEPSALITFRNVISSTFSMFSNSSAESAAPAIISTAAPTTTAAPMSRAASATSIFSSNQESVEAKNPSSAIDFHNLL